MSVKEQRVDGSSVFNSITVRCTLVAGKSGSWNKWSNSRLKIPQEPFLFYNISANTFKERKI